MRPQAVRGTYKTKPICVGDFLDVFGQAPAGHPLRDKLERIVSDAEEGDNVWMFQAFPHNSFPVEGLRVFSTTVGRECGDIDNALLWISHCPWSKPEHI